MRTRLGSDLAPYAEPEFDVTMVTLGPMPDGSIQRCVTRHRRRHDLERVEMLEPARLVRVVRAGKVCAWMKGPGWVELSSSPAGGAGGGYSPAGVVNTLLRPPSVAWGDAPGQLVVTFMRLRGTEELIVDWGRKVRMRERWLAPGGKVEREDVWEEAWVRGIRRPLRLRHAEHGAPAAPYTVSWDWAAGALGLNADELAAAP